MKAKRPPGPGPGPSLMSTYFLHEGSQFGLFFIDPAGLLFYLLLHLFVATIVYNFHLHFHTVMVSIFFHDIPPVLGIKHSLGPFEAWVYKDINMYEITVFSIVSFLFMNAWWQTTNIIIQLLKYIIIHFGKKSFTEGWGTNDNGMIRMICA